MKKIVIFSLIALLSIGSVFAAGTKESVPAQKTVTVFGAFVDEEARRFEEAIRPFEERTGIKVVYEGSKDFETLINVRVEGGNAPDIAGLPQPGLMANFASQGKLVPLWPSALALLEKNYAPVWKDLGSYKGVAYGVFHRVNAKSFVWYPKKAWDAAGYQVPKTWDELKALMDRMVRNGHTPWAVGIESGGATGWVGTDWIEDIMLRTAGPDLYDKWVGNEIPFNAPEVKKAFEILGDIWMNPKYVYGGRNTILTEGFGDSQRPLFDNPPKAWMHRQANFITGFFPEHIQANLEEEVGVFPLPAIDPKWGIPVLGGGDQFVVFNDRPEVREFMEYLQTWESAESWAKAGGALFPYLNQNLDAYPNAIERSLAEALVNAKVFRFDASDLMPASVGAGSFWEGIVDWVNGKSLDATLADIQKSWPK
ncbi:MAG: Multiple sugar-binding protein precursor [Spirochaetes bacterium ADurb.Bin315]|nr:MAG: Multiple sugar-binding protein precursor [Spirochaetes bacterium ADurb.Bin315]HOE90202.1 ABC transporter substrate-binding protein [Sphaerochaeta sp.]HOR80863.1 ABC transporter substrate-binding protein [Sphaerochaeta sp.]HPK64725.1 ABC transporter substrate-binding protein [Sphaerochaeta sp.]